MKRFKIDGAGPFGLFYEKKTAGFPWGSGKTWSFIRSFDTREEARAHYEKIKDLPEYLGGGQ